MKLSRRFFLQTGLAASLPGLPRLAFAATDAAPNFLLVVHLRGGADGLNLLSPSSDPVFIEARATDLRVAASGAEAGYALANSPDPQIDFRLHKSAGGLYELYQAGRLAFIPAAGLTDGTRSHFVATDMIERGVADAAGLGRMTTGWLARDLMAARKPGPGLAAIASSGTLPGDLAGLGNAACLPDLGGGLLPAGGPQVTEMLKQLYAHDCSEAGLAGRAALANLLSLDARLPRDDKGHPSPYLPDAAAHYDGAAEFARPLKTVAQLLKLDLGLSAATVDLGGWDTHEYQAGRIKAAIERLSNGLAAFWNDIPAYHDRVTILVLSEFGRRLRSNRSGGTDHGRAGLMMVLGGRIRGGHCYGSWPGLAHDQLDEGVDLAVTTDYRRVLTEILTAQHGSVQASLFPGYHDPGPLGLYAGPV